MSFDLDFRRQDGSVPSIPELKEYFSASPLFQVNDVDAGGVQFWYQNEATGVYCDFSYSPPQADESEESGSSGLTFNLNYSRPSFFALETMPLVEAFCKRFSLVVEDPQEQTVGPANASRLIASWRSHNAKAMRALSKVANEEQVELHYLPERRTAEWWRYMRVKKKIEDALTEDIFVPTVMILMSPAKELFTMIVWTSDIPQFFPPCDYVYVQRERKRFLGTKEEKGLVPYQTVLTTIGSLLDDYELGGLWTKYLRPEKAEAAMRLTRTLPLEPVVLRQFTQIAPDAFHDVDLSAEVGLESTGA